MNVIGIRSYELRKYNNSIISKDKIKIIPFKSVQDFASWYQIWISQSSSITTDSTPKGLHMTKLLFTLYKKRKKTLLSMSFSNILKWLVIPYCPYKPQFLLHCSIVSWLLVNQHLACCTLSEYFSTYLLRHAET